MSWPALLLLALVTTALAPAVSRHPCWQASAIAGGWWLLLIVGRLWDERNLSTTTPPGSSEDER